MKTNKPNQRQSKSDENSSPKLMETQRDPSREKADNFSIESMDNELYSFSSLASPLPSLPFARTNKMQWKYQANLVGEMIVNPSIHMCEQCQLPILIYGRMIPCKHVFCYGCAHKSPNECLRCTEEVFKIEKCNLGTVFICRTDTCRRTYLSQRDLEAHIKHRHIRKSDNSLR